MVDREFTLLGWGGSGQIETNPEDFEYGVFHLGTNKVHTINDNMLIYTMDRQGEEGGLPLEAIGYSGDSGGPALTKNDAGEWLIAGVKSNGECCQYGSENEYTRLGGLAYDWIMDNTAVDDQGNPTAAVDVDDC